MPKITKRIVDALEPEEKETFLWDSEIKGFGVRMMPTGVASYIIKYRNSENRQRKMTLGRVGTMTPEQARQMAREKLAEVSKGADPSAERQQVRQAINVSELCDLYQEETKGKIKDSTYEMNRSRIETHVKPLIGKHTVTSLTTADISKMMADIIAGRTAKARKGRGGVATGGKGVAGRSVGMMGTILEFAKQRGVVSDNVARHVRKPTEGKQKRFLSFDEITRLGAVMRDDVSVVENPVALAAIRFTLLTGCRRMEVLALPRRWLDETGGCIRFGDTKSGAQVRPIGASAFAALKNLPQSTEWVFPATRGDGHFVGLPKVLDHLCARANLEGVTVHVLRHSFAATAAMMGFSELVIAGLLGHSVPGVTARYAHVADSALVTAANQVSAKIAQLLDSAD